MKEFTPFSFVRSPRRNAEIAVPDPSEAVEMFPLVVVSTTGARGDVRDFRPQTIEEAPTEEAKVEQSADADPKAVTSSATDSVIESSAVSNETAIQQHPSSLTLSPESPASAMKDSNPSSDSRMPTGFDLPPV